MLLEPQSPSLRKSEHVPELKYWTSNKRIQSTQRLRGGRVGQEVREDEACRDSRGSSGGDERRLSAVSRICQVIYWMNSNFSRCYSWYEIRPV
jgi:hypothetical protein